MSKGIVFGRWASKSRPSLQNLPKGRVLVNADFGKLEQSAMTVMEKGIVVHQIVHDSITTIGPTARMTDDAFEAMVIAVQGTISGRSARNIWTDDFYIAPTSKLTNKVNKIIDNFWADPEKGLVYMYLNKIQRNPKTMDIFKGKSTTHHYPWYKRGTKY